MSDKIKSIIVDDEPIAREVMSTLLTNFNNVEVLGHFKNALEAFQFLNNNHVDLLFLDINMPDISGISFAKSISQDIQVIFTTAHRKYALEGFELQAVDYLLKPISLTRLSQALQRYVDINQNQTIVKVAPSDESAFIFIRSNRKMIKIDFDTIRYVESYSDYIKIHTADQVHVTRETISSVESKLPTKNFIRIHRSYIVAINSIQSYTNEHIVCEGKALSISKSYKKEVLERLKSL
ncbi:MAG: LytR/AlgR family response regulator transcription factor [bacterium]